MRLLCADEEQPSFLGQLAVANTELLDANAQLNHVNQDLAHANQRLATISVTDQLTQLANRRGFDLRLTE